LESYFIEWKDGFFAGKGSMEHSEVKSENARNVILSYNEQIYYVNGINAQVKEGEDKIKAVFHARKAGTDASQDLSIDISQSTYQVLLDYAKLDMVDLIMVLQINGEDAKWCVMSEEWLKNQGSTKGYIV
jgi:hypothetical protein